MKTPKEKTEIPYNPSSGNDVLPHPDQKYVAALLNNDPVLLDELYSRFSGKIKAMVIQNNGTETDAADIFQDALMAIYQKAQNGFVLSCPMEAFLLLVCKNKWINYLNKRKLQKTKSVENDAYAQIGTDSFREAEQEQLLKERQDLLKEKMAALSESTQRLLRISWSGKSMEEVAAILGVTYGYARKKKSEALDRLKELVRKSPRFESLRH